jgi:hypothetical protein
MNAAVVDRLDDEQSLAAEAFFLSGRHHRSYDSGQMHRAS